MQITPRVKAYLMLLVVAAIWGIATPVIKYTLEGFSPLIFLTYRFGISTFIALIIFSINGVHLPKDKKTLFLLFFYGFLNSVVSLGLLFFGMENTTVLESSLITLASPLIISTAGVYFLHEHVTKREKIGMGIAIIGTILTIIEPLINNGHSFLKLSGNLLILGYVLVTVVTTILAKNLLRKGAGALAMTNFSFIIGFLSFLPFVLFANFSISKIINVHYTYHLGVFFMAVLSGTFAFYFANKAQKTIEVGEQALFAYLYPVFSLPLAVLWLGEKITPIYVLGGVIIAIGVVIAEIKKRRYNSVS